MRFTQIWPADGPCSYGLIGGWATYLDARVERVGMCLCRIRGDAIEPIWAEVPPPIGEDFPIGAPLSLAIGGSRLWFVHAGRVESVSIDAAPVQPVRVVGEEPGKYAG